MRTNNIESLKYYTITKEGEVIDFYGEYCSKKTAILVCKKLINSGLKNISIKTNWEINQNAVTRNKILKSERIN